MRVRDKWGEGKETTFTGSGEEEGRGAGRTTHGGQPCRRGETAASPMEASALPRRSVGRTAVGCQPCRLGAGRERTAVGGRQRRASGQAVVEGDGGWGPASAIGGVAGHKDRRRL
jgi:hypothetical protein